MRKYMDEALKLIKDMQNNQESSIFKSVTDRFSQPASKMTKEPSTQIGTIGGGPSMDESRINEPSTMQSINGGPSTSRLRQYNSVAAKPFDSTSPRFNYKKFEEQLQRLPGPGQYSMAYDENEEIKKAEIKRTGTINKKYVPAIGNENRQRFSLFGQIVTKGQTSQLGPGSYEVHHLNNVASKKVFNASLMKQNITNHSTSLSSTNVKSSPSNAFMN